MKQFAKLPRHQSGSIYSTLIVLILFGVILVAALKIAPAYVDNNVLTNAVQTIAANNDISTMSIRDIRADIYKTLTTNNIDGFNMESVVVTKVGNKEYIDINYEARKPLFYNIDAVIKFNNRFDKF